MCLSELAGKVPGVVRPPFLNWPLKFPAFPCAFRGRGSEEKEVYTVKKTIRRAGMVIGKHVFQQLCVFLPVNIMLLYGLLGTIVFIP